MIRADPPGGGSGFTRKVGSTLTRNQHLHWISRVPGHDPLPTGLRWVFGCHPCRGFGAVLPVLSLGPGPRAEAGEIHAHQPGSIEISRTPLPDAWPLVHHHWSPYSGFACSHHRLLRHLTGALSTFSCQHHGLGRLLDRLLVARGCTSWAENRALVARRSLVHNPHSPGDDARGGSHRSNGHAVPNDPCSALIPEFVDVRIMLTVQHNEHGFRIRGAF